MPWFATTIEIDVEVEYNILPGCDGDWTTPGEPAAAEITGVLLTSEEGKTLNLVDHVDLDGLQEEADENMRDQGDAAYDAHMDAKMERMREG